MRHIFPFFCAVAWRKIPGRSEYIQGRRKVYKSEGASNNVVGIICPLIEIRLTYLPEFGGSLPPSSDGPEVYQAEEHLGGPTSSQFF